MALLFLVTQHGFQIAFYRFQVLHSPLLLAVVFVPRILFRCKLLYLCLQGLGAGQRGDTVVLEILGGGFGQLELTLMRLSVFGPGLGCFQCLVLLPDTL